MDRQLGLALHRTTVKAPAIDRTFWTFGFDVEIEHHARGVAEQQQAATVLQELAQRRALRFERGAIGYAPVLVDDHQRAAGVEARQWPVWVQQQAANALFGGKRGAPLR